MVGEEESFNVIPVSRLALVHLQYRCFGKIVRSQIADPTCIRRIGLKST